MPRYIAILFSRSLTNPRAPQANVTCTPSTPAPARKRRRPNQDLQERLARCEDLLKQYAGAGPPPGAPSKPAEPLTPNTMDTATDPPTKATTSPDEESSPTYRSPSMATGKMIKEDSGIRFMDSYIWASVMDHVRFRRLTMRLPSSFRSLT